MKAFLTGGAGFIGSHLADKLLEKGYEVTVFDNLSSGKEEFIKHNMDNEKFTFIQEDLREKDKVEKYIKNHDIVFHIAANPDVRLGAKKPVIAKEDILITYNILDAMRKSDINKIVFSSSSVIYGETEPKPLPEEYGPLLPISVYGAAKLASEGLISSFCHTFGMQGWMYRFANVVGERGTHGVIVDFIKKLRKNPKELEILGDGRQKKPYLYVTECVDGILYSYEKSKDEINVFNLGVDSATRVTRIAEIIVEEMGLENVEFKYTGGKRGWKGDVPFFQFDISKIKKLGWEPELSSDDAVRKATQYLLVNI